MRSVLFLSLWIAGLGVAGCGGDDDGPADAGGGDGGGGTDAGPGIDSGPRPDAGPRDAGPMGCTVDCELVELEAGFSHTCARRASGEVVCWGNNEGGQAGDGRMRHGFDCSDRKATMVEDCTPPVTVSMFDDATMLSSRGLSVCALREGDGEVWCWGLSGISTMKGSDLLPKRFVPTVLPGFAAATDVADGWGHQCAISDGAVRCHGENSRGQLGTADTMDRRVVVPVAGLTGTPVDVEVSPMHAGYTCVRNDAAEIWCWGSDDQFQLGDGVDMHDTCVDGAGFDRRCSFAPVQVAVPMGVVPVQISLGPRHACLLSDAGAVYCWGENAFGQLGLGDLMLRRTPAEITGIPVMTAVEAGGRSTCALDGTGQVWCWGGNEYGAVGDGMMSHGMTCDSGSSLVDCTHTPTQVMGLDDATHLSVGYLHACAIRETGDVACWGWNERMQLAQGDDLNPQFAPVTVMGLD